MYSSKLWAAQGKRHGKVVDYAVSESRAMDILEGVCDHMQDYVVSHQGNGAVNVVKVKYPELHV